MYKQIRVDQRLIHGQVTQGWVHALSLNAIVVLSQTLSDNQVAQKIMMLGVPDDLQVFFLSPLELAQRWDEWES